MHSLYICTMLASGVRKGEKTLRFHMEINMKPDIWLLSMTIVFSCMLCFSYGRKDPMFRLRAVNLGGWLNAEGTITPSIFDGIPNKNFLDGNSVRFKSVTTGKYLCAESGGGTSIVANGIAASSWETFILWRTNETIFQFRAYNKLFVGLHGNGLVAVSNTPGDLEKFEIVLERNDSNRVRIKASNGFFLQAKTEDNVTADFSRDTVWNDDDPSVFVVSIVGSVMHGEFQLTNGYGPQKAPQVMKEHWSTFIVEKDFKLIAESGLNAVRIPVGWWIASDPTPPPPYVGGSLQALDNAFSWAKKYGLKVIIELHAVKGSANGFDHGGSRDGSIEWGRTEENIQETVDVIDFLTSRYAKHPSLYAVGLLNEPISPNTTVVTLKKYYKAAYEAVRKHSSKTYVMLSNRMRVDRVPNRAETRELLPLARGLKRCVINVHYYNINLRVFLNMNVQQNIDYIYTNRSADLGYLTIPNGPPIFIGEWVDEWHAKGATKEDYQRFAEVQLDVYGRATFGWAYWTWKSERNHWNLQWMIDNGYIKL